MFSSFRPFWAFIFTCIMILGIAIIMVFISNEWLGTDIGYTWKAMAGGFVTWVMLAATLRFAVTYKKKTKKGDGDD